MAYRDQADPPPEIVLVGLGSTFRLRFSANLKHRRGAFVAFAVMSVVAAVGISFIVRVADASSFGSIFFPAVAVTVPALLLPLLIAVAVSSASPHPNERLLPSRMVLREDALEVFPREGEPFEAKWNYIAGATETPSSFDLLLRKEPRLLFVVYKVSLAPAQRDLMARWLRARGLSSAT